MSDMIKDFWGVFVGLVAAIAWLIRLEARIAMNGAAIERLTQQRHEDLTAAREARQTTNDTLKDVKSELGEIRTDIKALLRTR